MARTGSPAPEVVAPVVDGGHDTFVLSERLAEAPIVLAFFPAAFSGTCTDEMRAFRDRHDRFAAAGATIYGVSVDSPFALAAFRERHDLGFGLVSDFDRDAIDDYDVRTDLPEYGVYGLADRAVVVVDGDGHVAYRWVADHPDREPDYDAVIDAVSGLEGGHAP